MPRLHGRACPCFNCTPSPPGYHSSQPDSYLTTCLPLVNTILKIHPQILRSPCVCPVVDFPHFSRSPEQIPTTILVSVLDCCCLFFRSHRQSHSGFLCIITGSDRDISIVSDTKTSGLQSANGNTPYYHLPRNQPSSSTHHQNAPRCFSWIATKNEPSVCQP